MKRDIFRRAVRMTHKFGAIEGDSDPLYGRGHVFEPQFPERPDQLSSRPITIQQQGEYRYFSQPGSAVAKPNGQLASINGPAPDYADALASPIPVGTSQRLGNRAKKDKG
jgi:hypothetical protein